MDGRNCPARGTLRPGVLDGAQSGTARADPQGREGSRAVKRGDRRGFERLDQPPGGLLRRDLHADRLSPLHPAPRDEPRPAPRAARGWRNRHRGLRAHRPLAVVLQAPAAHARGCALGPRRPRHSDRPRRGGAAGGWIRPGPARPRLVARPVPGHRAQASRERRAGPLGGHRPSARRHPPAPRLAAPLAPASPRQPRRDQQHSFVGCSTGASRRAAGGARAPRPASRQPARRSSSSPPPRAPGPP